VVVVVIAVLMIKAVVAMVAQEIRARLVVVGAWVVRAAPFQAIRRMVVPVVLVQWVVLLLEVVVVVADQIAPLHHLKDQEE
jgi:hypothetical protein